MPNYGFKKTAKYSKSKYATKGKNYRGFRKYKRSNTYRKWIPNVMPETHVAYLNWQEELSLDAPGVGLDYATFSASGMYDPRLALGGHQPYGLDQLSAFYKYNKVLSSTITVTPVIDSVADTTPCYVAVVLTDSSTTPTFSDVSHFLEYVKRMGSKVITVGAFQALNSAINQTVSCKYDFKKWYNAHPDQEINWGIGQTANPAMQTAFFQVICYCINGNNPATRLFKVSINYKAKFFTLLKLAES